MNPEVKAKWVAALRSGEFEQGMKTMFYDGKYCCLGVLCELHRREFGGEWAVEDLTGDRNPVMQYLGNSGMLPWDVVEWAGLQDRGQFVFTEITRPKQNELALSYINDNGATFETIAQIIEDKL